MIDVIYNKKNYGPIPAEYNELSGWQLLRIASIIAQKPKPEIAALMAMRCLLQMSFTRFHLLPADMKMLLIPQVAWVFDDKNLLTAQLLPYYKKLHGPAGEFDNLTMAEWNACEQYYSQMLDGDTEAIYYLVAVLYRKKKQGYNAKLNADGDVREPFNPFTVEQRAKQVARWPGQATMAVLMWFDGCRESLSRLYNVFDGESEPGEHQPGMFEVMRNLAGVRYGSLKEVEQLNVHVAMREMELLKKEAEAMEPKRQTII